MSKQSSPIHLRFIIVLTCMQFCFFPVYAYAQDEPATDSVTIEGGDQAGSIQKEPASYFTVKEDNSDTGTVNLRQVPSGTVQKIKKQKDFWYADLTPENKEGDTKENGAVLPERTFSSSTWFQTLIWIIIIGGFATGIILYLSNNNVGFFRRKNKMFGEEQGEEITEDIFSINYQAEIDKARSAGNYRLAVRLHFLRMLKIMSEKQVIRYAQDKTNFNYLIELQSGPYYESFFRITRDYEYSWYGQFPVTVDMYELIRQDFARMDKILDRS
jgi:hypothetical protein